MQELKNMFTLKIVSTTDPILESFKHIEFKSEEMRNLDLFLGKVSAQFYKKMQNRVKIQLLFNGKAFYGTEYTIGDYRHENQGLVYHINEVIHACDKFMKTDNQKLLDLVVFGNSKLHKTAIKNTIFFSNLLFLSTRYSTLISSA
jgi:hypothetical protein